MSSSESDDEEIQKVKEAVSPELIQCMSSNTNAVEKPKSIRKSLNESNEGNFHKNILKTTPEFRNHLSQKLASYLDNIIQVEKTEYSIPNQIKDSNVGVKLLKNSSCFLKNSYEFVENTLSKTVKKNITSSSDSSDDEKFKQVAVSGVDILNGGEGAFKKEKIDQKDTFLEEIIVKKRKKLKKEKSHKKKFKGMTNFAPR